MESKTASTGGIGFSGMLAIVFITLKLVGTISWSWLWVLSPLWIPLAVFIGIAAVCVFGALVGQLFK